MSMERTRRDRFATHTIPLTWEIPAAAILGGLCLIAVTPLLVQGVLARALAGEFAWPTDHLGLALLELLHGHFGAGIRPLVAEQLPPEPLMWVLTIVGEAIVLGIAAVAGLRMRDPAAGSNARHGLATSTQAAQALGLRRLRKSAAVIRPDLHIRGRQLVRVAGGTWRMRRRR